METTSGLNQFELCAELGRYVHDIDKGGGLMLLPDDVDQYVKTLRVLPDNRTLLWDLSKINHDVRFFVQTKRIDQWRRLGASIVCDWTPDFTRHRSKSIESFLDDVDEESFEYFPQDRRDEVRAWLNATPYMVWRIVNKATDAGVDALHEDVFEMALNGQPNSTIPRKVQSTFEAAVRSWLKSVQPHQAVGV